jgi:prepilin-type N-terminal cleavage/methylation domain-containing protein
MVQLTQQQKHNISKDAGFTIIESLVAMIVASILMLAIAPVLILSTASRVQSRRVELGSQAARSFIDAIRSGRVAIQSTATTPIQYISTVGTTSASTASASRSITNNTSISDYLIISTNMSTPTSATGLYCVQSDGIILPPDCSSDPNQKNLFYIQAGRTIISNSSANDGYRLAVRVYRKDIDFATTVLANTDTSKNTQAVITTGSGNKQAPIVEMTTDVTNTNTTFTALCNRLGFAAGIATSNSAAKTCQD